MHWRRSMDDRILTGLAAGSARALDVGPAVARLTGIAFALALPVPAVVAYVVVALLVPGSDGRRLLAGDARERALGWFGVVCAVLLVTGAVVGGASLVLAHTEPVTLVALAGAALAVVVRASVRRRAPDPEPERPQPSRAPDDRPVLAWGFCAAALIVSGGVVAHVPAGTLLACTAAALASAALALPAARGARAAVVAALVVSVAAATVLTAQGEGAGRAGRVLVTPAALPSGTTTYRLGVGELYVDLRRVRVPAGGAAVAAAVDVGRVVIRVPPGAHRIRVRAASRLGIAEVGP